ncbi:hypothetical protein TIFTF001_020173 [Ficus carica]|uniref:Uncharacterized protein n=1 Tax=Ficus carica TaxID=3494 RepID=A0AA88A829_FICCA|nr:hypothetical protein TIFTF001_020173 [Ficus carica]
MELRNQTISARFDILEPSFNVEHPFTPFSVNILEFLDAFSP